MTLDASSPAAAAASIARDLRQVVEHRGHATLALAGGRTPGPVYDHLAAEDVPWSEVTAVMGDERDVDEGHERSNLGMARRHLGHLPMAWLDLRHEAPERVDVAVLGWGTDGHTASWFPDLHDEDLQHLFSSTHVRERVAPPSQPEARWTLTPEAILAAEHVHLIGSGAEKATVLDTVRIEADARTHPVHLVLTGASALDVWWWP